MTDPLYLDAGEWGGMKLALRVLRQAADRAAETGDDVELRTLAGEPVLTVTPGLAAAILAIGEAR